MQMFAVKLLANQRLLANVKFEHAEHFDISHFAYHLRYYII